MNQTLNFALGQKGEQIAYNYLTQRGYRILERNWRHAHLELDIIALKDDILRVIEVKTRSTEYFERPQDAVTIKKQKFLTKAAQMYITENNFEGETQFDIISIIISKTTEKIEHIEDAFYAI